MDEHRRVELPPSTVEIELRARYAARARRGAKWLDTQLPAWWQAVNINRLDIFDDCRCVLGQLYGSCDRAPLDFEEYADLGFNLDVGDLDWTTRWSRYYELLRQAWVAEIEDRLASESNARAKAEL